MPGGDAQSQARSHASAPRNGPAHLPARVRATMRTTSMRSARRQCAIAHVCARRACRRAATPLRVSGLPAKARRASDEPARRRCSASNVPSAGPRLLADRSSSRGGPAVRTMAWCVCACGWVGAGSRDGGKLDFAKARQAAGREVRCATEIRAGHSTETLIVRDKGRPGHHPSAGCVCLVREGGRMGA